MEMKNKLYRHHKSKVALIMRNFSISFLGLFIFGLAVTIPTYISIISDGGIPTLASEKDKDETPEETPLEEYVEEEEEE